LETSSGDFVSQFDCLGRPGADWVEWQVKVYKWGILVKTFQQLLAASGPDMVPA
jgi:hypothetical protein